MKKLLLLLITFVLPQAAQQNRIADPIDETRRVVLSGSVHPQAQPLSDTGAMDGSTKIGYATLILQPSPGQQGQLEKLLEEQQDQSSPNFHRWLTPEQF